MTRPIPLLAILFVTMTLNTCSPRPTPAMQGRIDAARWLTSRYSQSRLSSWNVRAGAAGRDCSILLIRTSVNLDDTLVESIHYGGVAYDIVDGGVDGYGRHHKFNGVAYEDRHQRIWTYGTVVPEDIATLEKCR